MHVGLITYQTGHRKTLEVTLKLRTRGHRITWYAFPFVKRAPKDNNRYPDRPVQLLDFDVEAFCAAEDVGYRAMGGWSEEITRLRDDPDPADVYLHCTSKIVPAHFLGGRQVLNCHPGLLPRNRGVDALKWSIVKGWPIGVTLHVIDEEIDRGHILYRCRVPLLSDDTLHAVCRRAYEMECDLLANFDAHRHACPEPVGDHHPISHARIPADVDARLESVFRSNYQLEVA